MYRRAAAPALRALRPLKLQRDTRVLDVGCGAFQFWGSEQYRRGVPLKHKRSYAVDPGAGLFGADEIAAFARRAVALNRAGQGDQAAFLLRKRA